MRLPKCAFIMTTRNGYSKGANPGDWIRQSLYSVKNQIYDGEFFTVMHNDGSNDATSDVRMDGIHYMCSHSCVGISEGFNRAASEAISLGAEWLFFQGDDDISEPNRISATMNQLAIWQKLGYKPDVMVGWISFIDAIGNLRTERAGRETRPEKIRIALQKSPNSETCLVLGAYSAEAWQRLGGMNTNYKYAGDLDMILRAVEANMVIAGTPRVLYQYRTAQTGNTFNISHLHREEHAVELADVIESHKRRFDPFHDMKSVGLKFAKKDIQERHNENRTITAQC